jgi:hypothetical protein
VSVHGSDLDATIEILTAVSGLNFFKGCETVSLVSNLATQSLGGVGLDFLRVFEELDI